MIVDLDECYCANIYSDLEIRKLFQSHSDVPHKHKKGGQSAARFGRIRENQITLWFKRINEYLKQIDGENLYVGISFIYKERFLSNLSTYNRNKIKDISKSEYGGITGVYQYIKKLENKS